MLSEGSSRHTSDSYSSAVMGRAGSELGPLSIYFACVALNELLKWQWRGQGEGAEAGPVCAAFGGGVVGHLTVRHQLRSDSKSHS